MVLTSRRFELWTRLYERMLLEARDGGGEPRVSTTVVPILDADRILQTPVSKGAALDLSGTAGTFKAGFTVPSGEEWRLIMGSRNSTSGTTSLRGIIGGGDQPFSLLGSAALVGIDLRGVTLREGDSIGMPTTGNGGDDDRVIYLIYDKLDLGE